MPTTPLLVMGSRSSRSSSSKQRSVPKPESPLAAFALPLLLAVVLVAGVVLIVWGLT